MPNYKGASFVTIMVIIAVCALLLRFTAQKLIEFNISQNEAYALESLKLVSAALESFAENNNGAYPLSLLELTDARPPYLDKQYIQLSPVKGYDYDCPKLDATGYICNAAPLKCKLTGNLEFIASTGAVLVTQECDKEE